MCQISTPNLQLSLYLFSISGLLALSTQKYQRRLCRLLLAFPLYILSWYQSLVRVWLLIGSWCRILGPDTFGWSAPCSWEGRIPSCTYRFCLANIWAPHSSAWVAPCRARRTALPSSMNRHRPLSEIASWHRATLVRTGHGFVALIQGNRREWWMDSPHCGCLPRQDRFCRLRCQIGALPAGRPRKVLLSRR